MMRQTQAIVSIVLLTFLWPGCGGTEADSNFHGNWAESIERPWAGVDYWSNPLQDWQVRAGRLECIAAGGDRNVFLLTRELNERPGDLTMRVRLGRLEEDTGPLEEGFAGFRLGIRGAFHDYRDSAVRGLGMNAGMAADGRLFIGTLEDAAPRVPQPFAELELRLEAAPSGENYRVVLAAHDNGGKKLAEVARNDIRPAWLTGGLALVSSSGKVEPTPPDDIEEIDFDLSTKPGTARGGAMRFWFRDWTVSGTKVDAHPERAYGPILFAMHTLSRGVLKLTAQMAPVGNAPGEVRLEIEDAPGRWKSIATATIDGDARTARFRVENWDAAKDTPYRVAYTMPDDSGSMKDYSFAGTVRKDPVEKPQIVVAAFTGNNDFGFPHADVVKHVSHFRPDFLAYTGDNIYERVGEYGTQRSPLDRAILDYLRKWYIFGWEYRDLLKEIPAVALPDDHDVYQGNIWGAGGRHAEGTGYGGQDKGGYTMPAEFVNVVQRTQTSNMPDPYDPTPVEQGIPVSYTSLLYGGVSFAVIEDRKWKSAPKEWLPKAEIINGWPQNLRYDAAREGDVPGAQLLGQRQLDFLNTWAADWSGGAWMKAVISQTIFADVATLPKGSVTDAITSQLRVLPPGEYAEGDARVMDHDSNGWPQTPRNNALRAMRRGMAFHIAGDQHLGSTVQYGIDDWNDAAYAICVPSVANIFPRRWFPPEEGRNRKPGSPKNTGEYLDGFGNKVTVHAVSNPTTVDVEPVAINQRAPGYGIVTFDRATRKITIANWPRWVDPSALEAKPYDGWPITIDQLDNGLSAAKWVLDGIEPAGEDDPVVQVIDESNGEIVYTLRIKGRSFVPRVFRGGVYTVKVGDRVYEHLRARRE